MFLKEVIYVYLQCLNDLYVVLFEILWLERDSTSLGPIINKCFPLL